MRLLFPVDSGSLLYYFRGHHTVTAQEIPMITHIVFFKLTDQSPDSIAAARDLLLGMDGRVPHLRHLEVGVDVIRSERSYDLALVTKFESLDDLAAYQVDPYHSGTVVPYMKSVCSAIAAVDYETAREN